MLLVQLHKITGDLFITGDLAVRYPYKATKELICHYLISNPITQHSGRN